MTKENLVAARSKVLEEARRLHRETPVRGNGRWKYNALKDFNSEIFQLMGESVPITQIAKAINEFAGFQVSVTTLRNFMCDRFADLYEQNYTSRAPITIKAKPKNHEESEELVKGSLEEKNQVNVDDLIDNYNNAQQK